jgi:hypothetical protein
MKRTRISIFFFFFISLTSCGQHKIENKLTKEHQSIKGTKISLIPPIGFTDASSFFGFQHEESGSSIIILDLPIPYSETYLEFSKEKLLAKGIEINSKEMLLLNSRPALLLTGTQFLYGNKYIKLSLVFGTDKETIIINGACLEDQKKIGKEIKKSMLTAYYEVDKKNNPFDALDFTFDVSDTKLKFGISMSNSLAFSVDGKIPTKSSDKTNLIVTQSYFEINQPDKKLFSLNRMRQMPVEIEKIESIEEITIDGISGYEIYAKGKNAETGEKDRIYQVMLFNDKFYYLFFGTTNDETDNSVEEIKKAVQTFKRK